MSDWNNRYNPNDPPWANRQNPQEVAQGGPAEQAPPTGVPAPGAGMTQGVYPTPVTPAASAAPASAAPALSPSPAGIPAAPPASAGSAAPAQPAAPAASASSPYGNYSAPSPISDAATPRYAAIRAEPDPATSRSGVPSPYGLGGSGLPGPAAAATLPPMPKKTRRRSRPGQTALVAVAIAILAVLMFLLYSFISFSSTLTGLLSPAPYVNNPPSGSFSVVPIVGTIQNVGNDPYSTQGYSYYHNDTVAYIKQLTEDTGNTGILLYMNTPGGGVYESDEVYLALEAYKEKTGRPVWAYMADMCASGGYYIVSAADHIVSNRNTTTGSIGVYIAMTDTSGLYEKLGIKTVLVKSGENKGTGMSGVPITSAQQAVYQGVVVECYEQFISLVASGRGLALDEVRKLADGRIYTGNQALELGLVDELGDWDATLTAFESETGGTAYWPSFSRQSQIARLIGSLLGELPQSDAEALLAEADKYQSGVPMALYTG